MPSVITTVNNIWLYIGCYNILCTLTSRLISVAEGDTVLHWEGEGLQWLQWEELHCLMVEFARGCRDSLDTLVGLTDRHYKRHRIHKAIFLEYSH